MEVYEAGQDFHIYFIGLGRYCRHIWVWFKTAYSDKFYPGVAIGALIWAAARMKRWPRISGRKLTNYQRRLAPDI